MCGISGIAGRSWTQSQLVAMVDAQHHRGPDHCGFYTDPSGRVGLGHNRLSILDLSPAGNQPMSNRDGTKWIVFNGEIYNYLELRAEIGDYPYHSRTDTEVVLAAYERWGEKCLDRFLGMFAFVIWDSRARRLFAARDRFGVKPLYYHVDRNGTLKVASEIKALHAAGTPALPDVSVWATYLTYGLYDHSDHTFWENIRSLPPGHALTLDHDNSFHIWAWYDLADRVGPDLETRPVETVREEYLALLKESVRLRFRSDVPVGINLSGGLDSSLLLGLTHAVQGPDSEVKAFTFVTGDPRYDELHWVEQMLAQTHHPLRVALLSPQEVPELACSVQRHEDEPFGGLPTIAYARLFECARQEGVKVLLDGQGMDEQWAGYDYYGLLRANGDPTRESVTGPVQGSHDQPVWQDCLTPEFRAQAFALKPPAPFLDSLRNRQYLDTRHAKIPRALRFNDRISMRSSAELREPFLDHRLFELALRQPAERKIDKGTHKKLLRQIAHLMLPQRVVEAPKRPLQTPQREWLREELRDWAHGCIEGALAAFGGTWLDRNRVRKAWKSYCEGFGDNSFVIWQWINLALWADSSCSRQTQDTQRYSNKKYLLRCLYSL